MTDKELEKKYLDMLKKLDVEGMISYSTNAMNVV